MIAQDRWEEAFGLLAPFVVVDRRTTAGLGAMADLGFLGRDNDSGDLVVITGYWATPKLKITTSAKTADKVIAAAHAVVEQGSPN
ncbi:hypothetical protein [Catenulispora subtropica]|uniref:Uncharacterized protein n=1 Tax=Catenulispora subtropica TaxID=450798 RepID=A0ABN2SXD4_9ACTN